MDQNHLDLKVEDVEVMKLHVIVVVWLLIVCAGVVPVVGVLKIEIVVVLVFLEEPFDWLALSPYSKN